jgi:hypothetical protein
MSDPPFRTVRLGKGAHASPESGACIVEPASMRAGERFSDHPRSGCPVIAGFLRHALAEPIAVAVIAGLRAA